jgi:hypothetical protein
MVCIQRIYSAPTSGGDRAVSNSLMSSWKDLCCNEHGAKGASNMTYEGVPLVEITIIS